MAYDLSLYDFSTMGFVRRITKKYDTEALVQDY